MKNHSKYLAILTSLVFSVSFASVSCSNGSDSPQISMPTTTNPTKSKKLKLDITNATNLYIGKSSLSLHSNIAASVGNLASNNSEKKLFKITEDGYAQEVSYTYDVEEKDKDGNVIRTYKENVTETFIPKTIIKLNEKYFIICFSSDNYLVNSATGECYKYTDSVPYIYTGTSYYGDSVITDSYDNIYFVYNSKIMKLDITNPESVTLSSVSASTESVDSTTWGVDKYGNIAYEGSDSDGNLVLRFKSTTDGFKNLPGNTNHSSTMFWQGLDGTLYYYNGSNPNTRVKKIIPSPFSVEDYEEEMINEYQSASGNMGACGFRGLLRAENKKRIILLADGNSYPEFYEVYNPDTNKLKRVTVSTVGLNKFKFGIATADYYYLVGTDSSNNSTVVKIEPTDYTYEVLLTGGTYDVSNLTISGDEIIFNALRMSDGAIILGKIASDKTISILDATLQEQITVLEKIK